jgi:hypothetical protein
MGVARLASGSMLALSLCVVCCGSESDDGGGAADACNAGEVRCNGDATVLETCDAGKWVQTRCMADQGKLCEAGACVDPWQLGSPKFDQCDGEPRGTPESLADKAASFEDAAKRLHVHPDLKWMTDVDLPAGVDPATAGWQDVPAWSTSANDGLWSALYLAAEAYRFAVTHDADALSMLKLLMDGETTRMRVTGVPGIFTRAYVPAGVAGIACPTNPNDYVPDVEKNDDKWVQIGPDGCIQTYDPVATAFVSSSACGLDEFAGWCWLDDVSQDEYSGHMLALGAVAELVDDATVSGLAKDLLGQVGHHLLDHDMQLIDWDGRPTEHGKIWAGQIVSGFQAAMSLAFVKTAAEATQDPELLAYYDDCLLKKNGESDCLPELGASKDPYDTLLVPSGLYLGCKANWNNFSMHMLSLHTLLAVEHDPTVRGEIQDALDSDMWNPPNEQRPLSKQNNALFDFIYAAGKRLGPASDGPALDAVKNANCMLRQFPASKVPVDISCPANQCVEVCPDRFGDPMSDYARPVAERCVTRFVWWGSPYGIDPCSANPTRVYSPADYLFAYWMGRYYGFIDASS